MKATALKTLLLTVGLLTPVVLLPVSVSASRGNSHFSVSYSLGKSHGRSHGSYGRSYGGSHHYASSNRHYSRSSYSHSSYRSYPSYPLLAFTQYSRPSYSISIGTGSWGGYYSYLPRGYSSCVVGGLTYYSHGGNYYRPYNHGYRVVADPYVSMPRTSRVVTRSVSNKYDDYPRIWVSGEEYLIDEGEIFRITSNGLVWAELQIGAIANSLPTHASSVWYKEVEYYEAGGLYFQRIPEGYRIVLPPWDEG